MRARTARHREVVAGVRRGFIGVIFWRDRVLRLPCAFEHDRQTMHDHRQKAADHQPEDDRETILRRERQRLVAVIPVRTSLEAYFVEKLRGAETTAGSTI